jgi:hypothetical protein
MAFQAHVGSADGRKNFAKAVKTFMDTNSAFNGVSAVVQHAIKREGAVADTR